MARRQALAAPAPPVPPASNPEGARRIWSRNATSLRASLVTHRYIYFAGTLAMRVAEQRFRTPFLVAFDAWLKTNPFTNPNAPKGPTYMPQYVQPELAQSNLFDARADNYYSLGEVAGSNADGYVRTTVYLASVLFLVGISGHFRVRGARRGLVTVGGVILAVSVVLLILAPRPPV